MTSMHNAREVDTYPVRYAAQDQRGVWAIGKDRTKHEIAIFLSEDSNASVEIVNHEGWGKVVAECWAYDPIFDEQHAERFTMETGGDLHALITKCVAWIDPWT